MSRWEAQQIAALANKIRLRGKRWYVSIDKYGFPIVIALDDADMLDGQDLAVLLDEVNS